MKAHIQNEIATNLSKKFNNYNCGQINKKFFFNN